MRVCQERARREGWTVVEVYADYAVSGASASRPRFRQLLADVRAGRFDVVLAESLDRISRDQEHVAGFYKQASFAGVRVVTLAEGEVTELHVGLKGTMGALHLRDLADKTRRGLEGRVRQGRSGGGLCYGYRVVRGGPLGRDGAPERGLREVDPAEAEVMRRIFAEFAAGRGPKSIAAALNREGVPGPLGGIWTAGAIRGQGWPWHRHPPQRALCWAAGVEPPALAEGPGDRPPALPGERPRGVVGWRRPRRARGSRGRAP